MNKLDKIVIVIVFIFASCKAENTEILKNRMKEYEHHSEEFNKKVNTIENDSLKQKLYEIAMLVFVQEMTDIKKKIVPVNPQYINDPYFLINSYDSYAELADNYINGQTLHYFSNREKTYNIQTRAPYFKFPFIIDTEWEEIILDNEVAYVIKPKSAEGNELPADEIKVFESGKWQFPKSFEIIYSNVNKTPLPKKVKANIQAKLPKVIHQFCFNKKDIGKTIEKDGISVKLLNVENTYVEFEVVTPEGFKKDHDTCLEFNWIKSEAKDKTGQFISPSNGSTAASCLQKELNSLYLELIAQDAYTNEFLSSYLEKGNIVLEKMKAIYNDTPKNTQYRYQMFRGVVEEIYVDVYDYSTPQLVKRDIVYPISDSRNLISLGDFKEIETTAFVYDNEIAKMFKNDFELSRNDLKSRIKIDQEPAMMSKSAVVQFKYPKLVSSKVIDEFDRYNKLKEITFLNKNKRPIKISNDSIGYDSKTERNKLVDFTVNRIKYHLKRFTETPHYVKGVVEVNLASIKKEICDLDNLPEGVLIKDNAVLLEQNIFNKAKYAIFVKDSSNRYLKLISGYSGSIELNGETKNQDISYYYGTPQVIEIYTLTDTQKVDYEFDIELTREESNKYSTMWY